MSLPAIIDNITPLPQTWMTLEHEKCLNIINRQIEHMIMYGTGSDHVSTIDIERDYATKKLMIIMKCKSIPDDQLKALWAMIASEAEDDIQFAVTVIDSL